ncbi:hypothetical protein HYC85_003567 [Camellia sinensis]|uniref:Uncharacterized protein n=1 Tax=Camellia sinensis TaxID=4442 RepID=A0A7J7HU28_CAMSI|nr:hypothetical protein HYC85_003567 [Camellia sinensis]
MEYLDPFQFVLRTWFDTSLLRGKRLIARPDSTVKNGVSTLSQFTKKLSLNLSSSHTISGFPPILHRLTFPTQTPQSLTVVSAKGYKMKTHMVIEELGTYFICILGCFYTSVK